MKVKKTKVTIGIVATLALIVTAGVTGWRYFKRDIQSPKSVLKPVVQEKVEQVVKEASDSLYKFHYTTMDISLDKGYAVINNLQMVPNETVKGKLLTERKLPNNIIQLRADKIILKGIALKKIEGEMAMHVSNMSVINPTVTVNNKLRSYNDTAEKKSWFAQLTKKVFTSGNIDAVVDMKIDNVLMKNATIVYINNNGLSPRTTRLKKLDFIISNVSTDALANKDAGRKRPSVVSIAQQRVVTADKLYYVDFKNIRVVPAERKLYVGSFELKPTLSKAAFRKAVATRKANYRYHLKATGISMYNIDLERLARTQQFHIPEVVVDYAFAEYYTNYNWPLRTPPNRRNKYPHKVLQKLAFDVTINKMRVKDGDMYFRILTKGSGRVAFFSMNNIRSVATNITNNTAAKNRNPYATITSDYKVMNKGAMHSKYRLNLKDKNGGYTVSSTLGPMDGTAYNPLVEPLAMMQIRSQQIEKMHMYMKADEYRATGNIDMYYKNYKVRLLKQGDDTTLKNRKLVSFTSNIIIPDDNPKKNGEFRKGPINIVRDERESFFGFQWRAMLDGVSSAMMGNDQQKDKPKNKVTRMAKLFYGPRKGQEHKSTGGDKRRLEEMKNGSTKTKQN